ncbi:IS630 family transposase [Leptolyngbya sp. AN02str]|uniref:IS630 family transposase n=1 Tax=Leptolyngbya sp. AN02str TaxID=3423363 RepID=UPI003D31446C
MRYWCSDESRIGLLTVQHRKLTGFGVQPTGTVQWQFVHRWLYGLVEPLSGTSWLMEFSHLDSACFEACLHRFAAQFPDELHLIQVDNAPAHTAEGMTIPDNVILVFQPPYCPELNPVERVWREFKCEFAWARFDDLGELQHAISRWVHSLCPHQMRSLTQWDWIVDALCVAGI